MKTLTYTITDENGIHARPAGVIVSAAKKFASSISISLDQKKQADAKKLFAMMGLGAKKGDVLTIAADGADENEAVQSIADEMRRAGL